MNTKISILSKSTLAIMLIFLFARHSLAQGQAVTLEKDGLRFNCNVYISTYKKTGGDGSEYPVIKTGSFNCQCVGGSISYAGKTYDKNSFNGELYNSIQAVKVKSLKIKGVFSNTILGGTNTIDFCFEEGEEKGNNLKSLKKGTPLDGSINILNICSLSGVNSVIEKIKELENKKKIAEQTNTNSKQPQNQESNNQSSNNSNRGSNNATNASPTSQRNQHNTTSTHQQSSQQNNQIRQYQLQQQQTQAKFQAMDNAKNAINNTVNSILSAQKAESDRKWAEKERRLQLEKEGEERLNEIRRKENNRHNLFFKFPETTVPTAVSEKAEKIYFFIYTKLDNNTRYVSNVFEIGKNSDGTRVYTSTLKNEIINLTPLIEVLHGYYYSEREAEKVRQDFITQMEINDGKIINFYYKGKPSSNNNSSNNISTHNIPVFGNAIGSPPAKGVKIEPNPNPNRVEAKSNNVFGKPIKVN